MRPSILFRPKPALLHIQGGIRLSQRLEVAEMIKCGLSRTAAGDLLNEFVETALARSFVWHKRFCNCSLASYAGSPQREGTRIPSEPAG